MVRSRIRLFLFSVLLPAFTLELPYFIAFTGMASSGIASSGIAHAAKKKRRSKRRRKKARRRKRRAKAKTRRSSPPKRSPSREAVPLPKSEATQFRGPTRIDFDDRLIQGQTNQSGAVYLFNRKETGITSMVRRRKSFKEFTVRTVYDP